MCMECRQYPCHPRCPNAPEPRPAMRCRQCRRGLFAGDRHFNGVCEGCLSEYSVADWMGLLGEKLEEVEGQGWGI